MSESINSKSIIYIVKKRYVTRMERSIEFRVGQFFM